MGKALNKAQRAAQTVERVQAILTEPVLTVAQVRAGGIDVLGTLEEIKRRENTVAAIGTPVMTDKALHVYYVTSTGGVIGKDGDFATQGSYAEAAGLSAGYVTRLKRLGRAMVEFGVRQGDKHYTLLAQSQHSTAIGEVFKAVDAMPDTATAAERRDLFRTGLDAILTPREAVEGETREARPNMDGDKDKDETPDGESRAVSLDDVLNALDAMVKDLDNESWAAVENRLNAIVSREVTIRSKVKSA